MLGGRNSLLAVVRGLCVVHLPGAAQSLEQKSQTPLIVTEKTVKHLHQGFTFLLMRCISLYSSLPSPGILH